MILTEIAKHLHGLSIVTFDESGVGGDCFVCTTPASPDSVVGIFPTGGDQADGKLGYDNPSVQFIIRGTKDPRSAYARAMSIYNALHGFHSASFIAGGIYVVKCVGAQSAPVFMGTDGNGRHEFSINFELVIRNTNRE